MKQKYLIWAEWCWSKFYSDAAVTEFISTRSGLPPVLLGPSQNAGSAVLEPGQTALSCSSWCLETQPVSRTRSCCCCWDRGWGWSRKAESFGKDGLVHCPSSYGGGCSKGESVSLGKCSGIHIYEQMLVADGQNHCKQGLLVHTGVFQDMSANEQRSAACMCTWSSPSPIGWSCLLPLEPCRAGSPVSHSLLCKAEVDFSSLVASSALYRLVYQPEENLSTLPWC